MFLWPHPFSVCCVILHAHINTAWSVRIPPAGRKQLTLYKFSLVQTVYKYCSRLLSGYFQFIFKSEIETIYFKPHFRNIKIFSGTPEKSE